jgi:hypothetical protein
MRSFLIEHLANFIFCTICVQNWDCFLVKLVLEVGHHEISILTSLAQKFLPPWLRFETLLLLRKCTKMFTDLLISDFQSPRMSGWCWNSFKKTHEEISANVKLTFLKSFFWISTNVISKHSCQPCVRQPWVHVTIGVSFHLHQLAKISANTKVRILCLDSL